MHLDKQDIHQRIEAPVMKDYGVYLAVDRLLDCQKPLAGKLHPDELQFQIVHQVEELWMKLMAFTLAEIDGHMAAGETMRVLSLFDRVNRIMRLMTDQLALLETMSPFDYQAIHSARQRVGAGKPRLPAAAHPAATAVGRATKSAYLDPAGRDRRRL